MQLKVNIEKHSHAWEWVIIATHSKTAVSYQRASFFKTPRNEIDYLI